MKPLHLGMLAGFGLLLLCLVLFFAFPGLFEDDEGNGKSKFTHYSKFCREVMSFVPKARAYAAKTSYLAASTYLRYVRKYSTRCNGFTGNRMRRQMQALQRSIQFFTKIEKVYHGLKPLSFIRSYQGLWCKELDKILLHARAIYTKQQIAKALKEGARNRQEYGVSEYCCWLRKALMFGSRETQQQICRNYPKK